MNFYGLYRGCCILCLAGEFVVMKRYNAYIKQLSSGKLPSICCFLGDEEFLKNEAQDII
jgi:hypothetical protein